jgi:hypothetical protein
LKRRNDKKETLTACSADFLAWSTCSTLRKSPYNFIGNVATSPTAYTPGALVWKNASVWNTKIKSLRCFLLGKPEKMKAVTYLDSTFLLSNLTLEERG